MALVRVGKVVRAVGLKGYLGVGGTEGGLALVSRVVLRRGGADEARAVLEARPQGRLWALRVEGISDRDAAEAAVGAEVLAERDELGEAGEGLHYWADLEGLPVVTVTGEAVGTVTGLYQTGGVDVLVVTGERGESLIPLAPYVEVDGQAGRIVVDPPEGLLGGPAGGEEEERG
jgi:16S rRNA processing protein RimM